MGLDQEPRKVREVRQGRGRLDGPRLCARQLRHRPQQQGQGVPTPRLLGGQGRSLCRVRCPSHSMPKETGRLMQPTGHPSAEATTKSTMARRLRTTKQNRRLWTVSVLSACTPSLARPRLFLCFSFHSICGFIVFPILYLFSNGVHFSFRPLPPPEQSSSKIAQARSRQTLLLPQVALNMKSSRVGVVGEKGSSQRDHHLLTARETQPDTRRKLRNLLRHSDRPRKPLGDSRSSLSSSSELLRIDLPGRERREVLDDDVGER